MDSFPAVRTNVPEWTVVSLSKAIRGKLEEEFGRVRVRGELGRISRPPSGHLYVDLREDNAVLSSVIWRNAAERLGFQPEEGLEVVATGRVSAYQGQSRYQLIIEHMELAGIGALLKAIEQLRLRLQSEGLFDSERKRPLPRLPEVIGVVTSPSGAVIRDILHRLRDRFPRRVVVWPAVVQGDACPREVVAAIKGFNALAAGGAVPRPDVIVVARGGGSVEDLAGFSEESVVRAAAGSAIPLVSAIGHETDTTLIDFAADLRAPTPTAAAELVVPVRAELRSAVASLEERRAHAWSRIHERLRLRLRARAASLRPLRDYLSQHVQHLDHVADRLPRMLRFRVSDAGNRLEMVRKRLRTDILRRGVAVTSRRLIAAKLALSRVVLASIDRRENQLKDAAAGFSKSAILTVDERRKRLENLFRLLNSVSYRSTLQRGFAVIRDSGSKVVSRASEITNRAQLEIEFYDGKVSAEAQPVSSRREAR